MRRDGVFLLSLEHVLIEHLADHHPRVVTIGQSPQTGEERQSFGSGLVLHVPLELQGHPRGAVIARDRIVAKFLVVEDVVDHIQPKAVDAAIQPELRHLEDGGLDIAVPVVEVGLLAQEIVQIVLTATRTPRPGRAPERGLPIVRRRAVRLGVSPDVPIGFGVVARSDTLQEPWMSVRRV